MAKPLDQVARFGRRRDGGNGRSLANGKLICADATRFFAEWLPDQCVAAVHVYFPDPWWKKRHKKRRVLNESFVQHVQRVLQREGTLHFWTDVQEYFEVTLELLASHTSLRGPRLVAEGESQHDLDFRTHFERRCRQAGLPVFRSEWVKG